MVNSVGTPPDSRPHCASSNSSPSGELLNRIHVGVKPRSWNRADTAYRYDAVDAPRRRSVYAEPRPAHFRRRQPHMSLSRRARGNEGGMNQLKEMFALVVIRKPAHVRRSVGSHVAFAEACGVFRSSSPRDDCRQNTSPPARSSTAPSATLERSLCDREVIGASGGLDPPRG
jgi:hypothetical protein